MYIIYINDRPLILRTEAEVKAGEGSWWILNPETHLETRYSGKARTLLHYADMLEKGSPKVTSVEIHTPNLEALWADFRSHYRWIPAAGGVVRNRELNAYLAIYRRSSWDLPKGKIDKGEDEPTAALREVEEETGIADLTLGNQLATTYHTYHDRKSRRVLKPTYWFVMETDQSLLTPEVEEDIERAEWMDPSRLREFLPLFYKSQYQLIAPLTAENRG